MTRANITPEALITKGYQLYMSDYWTWEKVCKYIREGCGCKLKPNELGHMVGVLVIRSNGHVYEHDVFSRDMTPAEKEQYKEWMAEENKRKDIYNDWFDSREEAENFVEEAKMA